MDREFEILFRKIFVLFDYHVLVETIEYSAKVDVCFMVQVGFIVFRFYFYEVRIK